MALPHLIKYIYNNGTDEVIRRGKKIHAIGNVELVEYDDLTGSVTFRVKDDSYSTYYKVYVSRFKELKDLSIRCGCPYNLGEICRHEAAALFQLQDMVDKNQLGEKEVLYDQRHTVIKMKQLDLKMIKLISAQSSMKEAEEYLRGNRANIISAKDERVDAELEFGGSRYNVVIQKNEERNFDTSCNCDSETTHPLCVHKTILLLQLLHSFGPN
ncbi:MAG TPA: SWIM zinc finger family protein, partial [Chitinophagaceae bacterium]